MSVYRLPLRSNSVFMLLPNGASLTYEYEYVIPVRCRVFLKQLSVWNQTPRRFTDPRAPDRPLLQTEGCTLTINCDGWMTGGLKNLSTTCWSEMDTARVGKAVTGGINLSPTRGWSCSSVWTVSCSSETNASMAKVMWGWAVALNWRGRQSQARLPFGDSVVSLVLCI